MSYRYFRDSSCIEQGPGFLDALPEEGILNGRIDDEVHRMAKEQFQVLAQSEVGIGVFARWTVSGIRPENPDRFRSHDNFLWRPSRISQAAEPGNGRRVVAAFRFFLRQQVSSGALLLNVFALICHSQGEQ